MIFLLFFFFYNNFCKNFAIFFLKINDFYPTNPSPRFLPLPPPARRSFILNYSSLFSLKDFRFFYYIYALLFLVFKIPLIFQIFVRGESVDFFIFSCFLDSGFWSSNLSLFLGGLFWVFIPRYLGFNIAHASAPLYWNSEEFWDFYFINLGFTCSRRIHPRSIMLHNIRLLLTKISGLWILYYPKTKKAFIASWGRFLDGIRRQAQY